MFDVCRFNYQKEDWEVIASFDDFDAAAQIALERAKADGLEKSAFSVKVPQERGVVTGEWPSRIGAPRYVVACNIDPTVERI